jgi:hypothetical protein
MANASFPISGLPGNNWWSSNRFVLRLEIFPKMEKTWSLKYFTAFLPKTKILTPKRHQRHFVALSTPTSPCQRPSKGLQGHYSQYKGSTNSSLKMASRQGPSIKVEGPWKRASFYRVSLIPKGRRPFFGLFLEFGQPIVNAIFVQKISNFWWTCGLVIASKRTNFYKIPISGLAIMPQKHNYFELRAASGSQKTFYF